MILEILGMYDKKGHEYDTSKKSNNLLPRRHVFHCKSHWIYRLDDYDFIIIKLVHS